MELRNKISAEILKNNIKNSTIQRETISFYKYHVIKNPPFFRDYLYVQLDTLGVLGRIYVAKEGINAQISVPSAHKEKWISVMNDISFLNGIRLNYAIEDDGKSFYKLTIKVRDKIVADGIHDPTFNSSDTGVHLNAKEFNQLIEDPQTLLVDMRNHYESEIGHFENAICPNVDRFKDQLPLVVNMLQDQKERPVVMYCTGGIRCEKASAYLKHHGFKHVYQLNGGIIEYARQIKKWGIPNKFRGKNFVFDDRLSESISSEIISHCHQCGQPSAHHVNCANTGCNLLFIQCEECGERFNHCCGPICKDVISWDEEKQLEWRKKNAPHQKIFSKGRIPKTSFTSFAISGDLPKL
jgi:UPF0176 protein